MRTGTANLPLHGGSCPRWLFPRMKELSGCIAEAIIDEYGQEELLKRLSNPYFLQSLGCTIGFDWHSSGLTTTTMSALKEGLSKKALGITIAGGKRKASRKTQEDTTGCQTKWKATLKSHTQQYWGKEAMKHWT